MSRTLAEKLRAFDPDLPLERAHTIPSSWYHDPEIYAAECRSVFGGTWQAVGRTDQVAEPGTFFTLLGPSGCGKTTLLHVIAGISTPDAGQVVIDGTDIVPLGEAERDRVRAEKVGYIFQTFNQVMILTKGGPGTSTNLLMYKIYEDGFANFIASPQLGYATAEVWVLFVIVMIVTLVMLRFTRGRFSAGAVS